MCAYRSLTAEVQCQIKNYLQRHHINFAVRKFDIGRLNHSKVVIIFEDQIKKELAASEQLGGLCTRLNRAATNLAKKPIGSKKNKRDDWFDSNNVVIQDFLNRICCLC